MGTSTVPQNLIKLKNAGESVTLQITACAPLAIGTYPEIEFTGTDGRGAFSIRVPKKSADRQLERAGLTYASAVGKTLKFSRDANQIDASKPFWGIVVMGGKPVLRDEATQAAPDPEPPEDAAPSDKGAALYRKITEYVLERILPLYEEHGIAVTHEGTAAIVATMYIQANR